MSHHQPTWRKSSYSVNAGQCVEVAAAPGNTLVRDSEHPDAGHLNFATPEIAALVNACGAGHLDHLTAPNSRATNPQP